MTTENMKLSRRGFLGIGEPLPLLPQRAAGDLRAALQDQAETGRQ